MRICAYWMHIGTMMVVSDGPRCYFDQREDKRIAMDFAFTDDQQNIREAVLKH